MPIDHKAEAQKVIDSGDSIEYILATWLSLYVGNRETGQILIAAIGCQVILNSDGIHPKFSGRSGTGKTVCIEIMLHLCPQEYVVNATISDKAMFYAELKPGTIIFQDDAVLTESITGTIKRSTSRFQQGVKHVTVMKQTQNTAGQTGIQKQELEIPARVSWWITSVDNNQEKQLLNRQILLETDETPDQDEKVYQKQVELAEKGIAKLPDTDGALICREIIRDLKEHTFIVKIPFARTIVWKYKSDRRAFSMFCDIIKAFTAFRYKKRTTDAEGGLIAEMQDYTDALKLWNSIERSQTTKLNSREQKAVDILINKGEIYFIDWQTELRISGSQLSQMLKGRDGRTGLLEKVPEILEEKVSVETGNGSRWTKKYTYNSTFDPNKFKVP